MKKGFTKYTAIIMILIIVLCFSEKVVAGEIHGERETEGNYEIGIGELEGTVETNIYQVVMPTSTKGVFDFIIDPQGLINKTNAAAYDDKSFEADSTLFFKRTDGKTDKDYSNKSDFVTIINKSSVSVDVSIEVEIDESSIEGITMSDNREFVDDTSASIYLALISGENEIPITKEGASIHITLDAVPEAYEYVYNSDTGEYVYELNEELDGIEFPEYSFQLTGAANGKGDWSEVTKAEPKVKVTWRTMLKDNEK